MAIIERAIYMGNSIRLLDYGRILYIPIYNFFFGKMFVIDAMGGRYVKKRRTLAIRINRHQISWMFYKIKKKIQLVNKCPTK